IEQLHKTLCVEPVKCVRGRHYVIVVAQAVVPISVPEVAHEILSGNAFAPIYSIANRDEKHITVDTVDARVPIATPYAPADIAGTAAHVQNPKISVRRKRECSRHQFEVATLRNALFRPPQLQQFIEVLAAQLFSDLSFRKRRSNISNSFHSFSSC